MLVRFLMGIIQYLLLLCSSSSIFPFILFCPHRLLSCSLSPLYYLDWSTATHSLKVCLWVLLNLCKSYRVKLHDLTATDSDFSKNLSCFDFWCGNSHHWSVCFYDSRIFRTMLKENLWVLEVFQVKLLLQRFSWHPYLLPKVHQQSWKNEGNMVMKTYILITHRSAHNYTYSWKNLNFYLFLFLELYVI